MEQHYWVLATLGLMFLMAELFLGSQFFLFFLSVVCFITALVGTTLELTLPVLLTVFSVLALVLLFIWHQFFRQLLKSHMRDVNHTLETLKGSSGVVLRSDGNGQLKIKVHHTLWTAHTRDRQPLPVDSVVRVVATDKLSLIVELVREQHG